MDATKSLCRPSQAGAAAGAVTGLVVWALVSFVPAFRNGVPTAITAVIPFALAWAGHVAAAWLTGPGSHSQGPVIAAAAPPAPGSPVTPRPGAGSTATGRPPASRPPGE